MSKADRKTKGDSDILRAGDVVPPYDEKAGQKQDSLAPAVTRVQAQKAKGGGKKISTSQKEPKQPSKDIKSPAAGKKGMSAKVPDAQQQRSEIPKLDLAEKIMAEQRKVTSVRRKGPGGRGKTPDKKRQVESTSFSARRPTPGLGEQEQIIAEIVAGDIEELCRGGSPSA